MDVLCSDKTGTITKNELTIGEIRPFEGFTSKDVLLFGILASRKEDRDPIDDAVIAKAEALSEVAGAIGSYKVSEFKPFDPVSKRTEATIEDADGKNFKVTKGAPQVILSLVSNKESIRTDVNKTVNAFASRGYRALSVAETDGKGRWQFAGLIALYDPPREDSAETIKTAQAMGVQVKMVTGDHVAIAKEIAEQVNLGTNILPSSAFLDKSDREAQHVVDSADGFAQVFPEHKYHIVELLQSEGHIVGMTGDGVNDAPALKRANIGLALGSGTDVAKEASDLILLTDNFSIIITAVKEGRTIVDNIRKVITLLLSNAFGEMILIGASIIAGWPLPILAAQILWVNLIEDSLPAIALGFEKSEKGVMKRKPEDPKAPLLTTASPITVPVYAVARTIFPLTSLFR